MINMHKFIHFFIQQIFLNSYFMLGVILDNRNTEMNRSFHGAYILKEGKQIINNFLINKISDSEHCDENKAGL